MNTNPKLDDLMSPKDYISDGRTHIFPSESSLLWFIRKNKKLLTTYKAVISPTGRTLINAPCFDQVVMYVGSDSMIGDQS